MATITVTTAADVVSAGDGVLSLREAVQQANATTAADAIVFASALEGQTLTLTQGQLTLSADLSIDGDRDDNGSEAAISGGGVSRVLAVAGVQTDVTLNDLAILDGNTLSPSGDSGGGGAGIWVEAGLSLQLNGCTISGNDSLDAFGAGAGVFVGVGGRLQMQSTTISDNLSYGAGGGLFLASSSSAVITGCTIQSNLATEFSSTGNSAKGGGIYAIDADVQVLNSTILQNGSVFGGGIHVKDAELEIGESTVASNRSGGFMGYGSGGGLRLDGGSTRILNSTITNNTDYAGPYGRFLDGAGIANSGLLALENTIISGNVSSGSYQYSGEPFTANDDVQGRISFSNGHNIFGSSVDGGIAGDEEFVSATLLFATVTSDIGGGVFGNNGGATPTVALRDAIDNPAVSGAEPVAAGAVDQRGVARPNPAASNPDIGAFELNQTALSTTASPNNDVLTGTAAANTLGGLEGADLLLGLAGNDTLNGSLGNDTLRGGLGNDILNGAGEQDTASYRDATAAVIVSLAGGTSTGALGADILSGIESLEGGSGGDSLTGDGLANGLSGLTGNDRLYGLTGNDRLYGGAGDDLLEGGFGDDWLDGGADIDTVSYVGDAYPLAVTINLTIGQVTRSGEVDRLQGIENADGTNNADTLFGDTLANRLGGAGGADTIKGLGGDDVLIGGLGNDSLDGDAGLDLADFTSGTAVTVDLSLAADRATQGAEVDTLLEIEGAIGSANADTFRGDALANLFRGQGGKDTATGGAGADDFDYDAPAHSTVGAARDVITDFTPGVDDLDLSTIDARSATPAVNDAFTFLAVRGAAFTGAGQVRWYQSSGVTLVEANLDANLAPDLQIQLTGLKTLSSGDFVL